MSVPHRPATLCTALFLALAAAPAAPASDGAAQRDPLLVQDALTAYKDDRTPGVRVTLNVRVPKNKDGTKRCVEVLKVGVAVRGAEPGDWDYHPSIDKKTRICSDDANKVFTTEPKKAPTKATYFGYYQALKKKGEKWEKYWYPLSNAAPLTVTPTPDTGRKEVFKEEFKGSEIDRNRWNNTKSGSYKYLSPNEADHGTTNVEDNKLDRITPDQVKVGNDQARFTAVPGGAPLPQVVNPKTEEVLEESCLDRKNRRNDAGVTESWKTGLLTTQDSNDHSDDFVFRRGFTVKRGDYVETRVEMPTQEDAYPTGAWPALWTWGARTKSKEPGKWEGTSGEIDSYEYHPGPRSGNHPGHPNRLELTNRLWNPHPTADYINEQDIKPGTYVTIGTYYGEKSVKWYVNGNEVFADEKGVPEDWRGFLILNLSVSGDCFGRQPKAEDRGEIGFSADYVRVYR